MCIVLTAAVSACSAPTMNTATRKGATQLTAREIYDLVSGNTMNLVSYDFAGDLYFSESGAIAGRDKAGQLDSGGWDIKDNDSLCLKFKSWYYGDINCYFLTRSQDGSSYSFFRANGSAYYQGTQYPGNSAGLKTEIEKKKKTEYLRSRFRGEGEPKDNIPAIPAIPEKKTVTKSNSSEKDTSATLRQLALDCPGCNFSHADLKEALLAGANLEGVDLSGADLRYANLRRANLKGADLSGARLNQANLPGADLRECNLRNADLSGANLLLADLTGADLTGAVMINTYLEKTKGVEHQQ